jgi:hypothetical protein
MSLSPLPGVREDIWVCSYLYTPNYFDFLLSAQLPYLFILCNQH